MVKKDVLSKYSDFKSKKFLVIDDFPEFRTAIKRMVEAFGGEDVDTSSNGDNAIEKIKANHYDAIMCDYNLGDGKDGQQVLEEAKYKKALKNSQIFLMLTAESTAEMVMGALEYEPDGYLIKPFTKDMVHNRLTRIMQTKKEMLEIHKAYEKGNLEEASKLCDERIAQGGRVALHCLKFKGRILLENQQYEEAKKMYESLAGTKKLPWVALGLAKIYYKNNELEEAKKMFNEIIHQNAKSVEAYDWLAKIEAKEGNFLEAQDILESAVKMSSKAILRQQALARVAITNKNLEVAEKALRHAIELGKHSCYRSKDDYIQLAKILTAQAKEKNNPKVANEAVTYLEALSNSYISEKDVQIISMILQADALVPASRTDKAKVFLRKLVETLPKSRLTLDNEYYEILGNLLTEHADPEDGKVYLAKAKGEEYTPEGKDDKKEGE